MKRICVDACFNDIGSKVVSARRIAPISENRGAAARQNLLEPNIIANLVSGNNFGVKESI